VAQPADEGSTVAPRTEPAPEVEPETPTKTEFDSYALAVEMADRVSARRGLANSFFLTINTAVAGALSANGIQWQLAAAGVVLSVSWWALLTSYRRLNAAKFSVILALEQRLPVRIFTDEWAALQALGAHAQSGRDVSRRGLRGYMSRYQELGRVERIVPWVFVALYAVELVRAGT
jgi:hypothetical protein